MNRIRWGLLSTANINRRVIPAIRESARGELAAVASRRQNTAHDYAAQWDIPQSFGSYEEMLASDAIDAVYIGLPNHLHAPWTIQALRAGKHVLCEKPFALTLDEVNMMILTAHERELVLAEAFMYRHHPQMRKVGEILAAGQLGQVTLVRAVFNFNASRPNNVRFVPEYGGGSLWDVGIYPVSFAQYVMGEPPQWVMGDQWEGSTGVDESFAGQMHYRGGRMAQIASAFRNPFYTMAEVIGTEGRLFLSDPFVFEDQDRCQMIFYPLRGQPQHISVPMEYLYLGEIEDMHAAILDGTPSYLTLDETRNHVRTALALYESAITGQIVTL